VSDELEPQDASEASKLAEIMAVRREKVASLRATGIDPYPPRFRPTHTLMEVRDAYHHGLEAQSETDEVVTVAGRVVARRELGRFAFLVLRESGVDLQLFCRGNALDDAHARCSSSSTSGTGSGRRGRC
jgi:lysyl-tRNA synthetase, class II